MAALPAARRAAAVAEAQRLMTEGGLSANKAAERAADALGVTGRTVKLWAQQAGTPLGALSREAAKTTGATAALSGYTAARRLALCDRLLGAVEERVAEADAPGMQKLAMAFAVLSDKREHLEGVAALLRAYADPAYWEWAQRQQDRDFLAPERPFVLVTPGLGAERFHLAVPAVQEAQRRLEAERAARFAGDEDDEDDGEGDEDSVAAGDGLAEAIRRQLAGRLTDAELRVELARLDRRRSSRPRREQTSRRTTTPNPSRPVTERPAERPRSSLSLSQSRKQSRKRSPLRATGTQRGSPPGVGPHEAPGRRSPRPPPRRPGPGTRGRRAGQEPGEETTVAALEVSREDAWPDASGVLALTPEADPDALTTLWRIRWPVEALEERGYPCA